MAAKQIGEPFGAAEVSDIVGLTPQQTTNRLSSLVEDGTLEHKKIAGSNVYWIACC